MASLQIYKTYSFRDKDPVIDQLRTLYKDSGMTYAEISRASRVAPGTLHNWFHGKTRRPQSASIEAAGRAMGFARAWVPLAASSKAKRSKRK